MHAAYFPQELPYKQLNCSKWGKPCPLRSETSIECSYPSFIPKHFTSTVYNACICFFATTLVHNSSFDIVHWTCNTGHEKSSKDAGHELARLTITHVSIIYYFVFDCILCAELRSVEQCGTDYSGHHAHVEARETGIVVDILDVPRQRQT